jgi:DNA-binding transcriptional MerR regulator
MAASGTGMMTIGQLADRFGLATHVLRHWEAVGLLEPAARVNGRRKYRADQAGRVALIIRGKAVGMTLADIREMVDAPDPDSRRTILQRHHDELGERIAQAQAARAMVEHAMTCEYADFTRCPTFRGISERGVERLAHQPADCLAEWVRASDDAGA